MWTEELSRPDVFMSTFFTLSDFYRAAFNMPGEQTSTRLVAAASTGLARRLDLSGGVSKTTSTRSSYLDGEAAANILGNFSEASHTRPVPGRARHARASRQL